MLTQSPELRTDVRQEILLDEGLLDAAQYMRNNPRQLKSLEMFRSGEIHTFEGGALKQRGPDGEDDKVFWHEHGTFVAPDGAIYQLRTEDWDKSGQVYMAPSQEDERSQGVYCIRPLTFDLRIGPYGITMGADFVNGMYRTPPCNTIDDARLQMCDGLDATAPRHKEWPEPDRDSLSIRKFEDGHIEAELYDSEAKTHTKLYAADEVMATIDMLSETDNGMEGFLIEAQHTLGASAYRASQIGYPVVA